MAEKKNGISTKTALIGLGVYLGYTQVIVPLLESLNLMDTKEERAEKERIKNSENSSLTNDYWNENYPKTPRAGYDRYWILSEDTAKRMATEIYNAAGTFDDDEEKIFTVFRQLKYRTQVSYLVYMFRLLYKKDLYTWLRDKVLNQTEMNTVLSITNKLPLGWYNQTTGKAI